MPGRAEASLLQGRVLLDPEPTPLLASLRREIDAHDPLAPWPGVVTSTNPYPAMSGRSTLPLPVTQEREMKANRRVALALTVAAIGTASFLGAKAQTASAPTYLIAEVDVTDQAAYQAFGEKLTPIRNRHGGRLLVSNATPTAVDGTPPKIVAVIAFENRGEAKAYLEDPDRKALKELRAKAAKFRVYLVDGAASDSDSGAGQAGAAGASIGGGRGGAGGAGGESR